MNKILSGILIALFFSMTFLSCGLDTFYVVNSPIQGNYVPLTSNDDPNYNCVSFITNETGVSSDFSFRGTVVYYKIFGSKSNCEKSYTDINAMNNESNYSKASDEIITKYSPLSCIDNTTNNIDFFVVSPTGSNKIVEIRLTNYFEPNKENPDSKYMAHISVNGVDVSVPVRIESTNENKKFFNFGWHIYSSYADTCEEPNGPASLEFDGSSASDFYYVNLYALGYGQDVTYTSYYSRPLHLGVIKIKPSSPNNWN